MNRKSLFLSEDAHVDNNALKTLPNSKKIYIEGSREDIKVPMRKISQSNLLYMFMTLLDPIQI